MTLRQICSIEEKREIIGLETLYGLGSLIDQNVPGIKLRKDMNDYKKEYIHYLRCYKDNILTERLGMFENPDY